MVPRPATIGPWGHDAASVIAAGLSRAGSATGMIAALDGATMASPRGQLKVGSGTVLMPLYLRQVRSVNGRLVNTVVGNLEAVPAMPEAKGSLAAAVPSGYLNEVLCPA